MDSAKKRGMKRKVKIAQSHDPGAPKPKMAAPESHLHLPAELMTRIVQAMLCYRDVTLKDVLQFSQTCSAVRSIVLQEITQIGWDDYSKDLLTTCSKVDRPSVLFKTIGRFYRFLSKVSPKSLSLPQATLHYSPEIGKIADIDFCGLQSLSVKICRLQDWEVVRTILANSTITELTLEAAKNFCGDRCRYCIETTYKSDYFARCRCSMPFLADNGAIARSIEPRAENLLVLTLKNWQLSWDLGRKYPNFCQPFHQKLSNLQKLDISECHGSYEAWSMAMALPHLHELRCTFQLFGYTSVLDEERPVNFFENLHVLILCETRPVQFSFLRMPKVKHFRMDTPLSQVAFHLSWISETAGCLESVFLENIIHTLLNDDMVDTLITRNPGLKALSLISSTSGLTFAAFRSLPLLRDLRYLVYIDRNESSNVQPETYDILTPEMFPKLEFVAICTNVKGTKKAVKRLHDRFEGSCQVVCASSNMDLATFMGFKMRDPIDWSFPFLPPWSNDVG